MTFGPSRDFIPRRCRRGSAGRRTALTWLASVVLVANAAAEDKSAPLFEEVPPAKSGIHWVHTNAMSDERYLPETLGPGVAFLDYDGDGFMDLFFVNSGLSDFYKPPRPIGNALYRNNGDGTFTDVTEKAGVAGGTFGMGVAVGDYDNDGFPDIYVTAYGRATLYHNDGHGHFTDVTEKAGVGAAGWTTSAVWFDYDNDGKLDLFAESFVEFGVGKKVFCGDNKIGKHYYCIPRVFKPTASHLFHNNGDGTFTDTSGGTDIGRALGKGLGAVATDVNNDGRMDLFVSNDTVQNFLFMNRGDGKWEEIGLASEVGFSSNGKARSGMGVDSADFDEDGLMDLFVANVDQEMYSLYKNSGKEWFSDVAFTNEIAQVTRFMSGWGVKFLDYDDDGHLDLVQANGHPDDQVEIYAGSRVAYKEPTLLFHGDGKHLTNVTAEAGPFFTKPLSSRGLAIGDYDNDGHLDVLIGNNGDAPSLLHNRAGLGNHWVGLQLEGTTCNRDAVGAVIRWSAGGVRHSRLKISGGSYLSSHDVREVLGLGHETKLDWVEVQWPAPSTKVERLTDVPLDRYVRVVEGKGIVR